MPSYPNITNFGLKPDDLLKAIDAVPKEKEWGKVLLLINDADYSNFLCKSLGVTGAELAAYAQDFLADKKFYEAFSPKLLELETMPDAGDLRLNSLVPYLAVRALKPKVVVETGVAAGKSSALFLLGLAHNGFGRLISIDLPNDGTVMQDGAQTTTQNRPTGWLVPEYLRDNWELVLEDSKTALQPMLAGGGTAVDIFMHDSLHTYEHVTFEFTAALSAMKQGGLLMCDNIEEGQAGQAFSDFLHANHMTGYAYRNFACARL